MKTKRPKDCIRYIRLHRLFAKGKPTTLHRKLRREGWRVPNLSKSGLVPVERLHSFDPPRFEVVHSHFL